MWATLITRMMQVLRRILHRLAAWERRLAGNRLDLQRQQAAVMRTTQYDMVASPDEEYYAEQYEHWFGQAVMAAGLPHNATCLDLGCGHGRLALGLAKRFPAGHVQGVDFSEPSIEAARRYAQARKQKNITFTTAEIGTYLRQCASSTFDFVLMAEVTIFFPQWRDTLPDLLRVLRPGGLLAIAFRPLYCTALNLTRQRAWNHVPAVLSQSSGRIHGNDMVLTWQETAEVRRLFVEELRLELLQFVGIGCCSGISYDAHSLIVQPGHLAADERASLQALELGLGPRLPDAGRFILAIGRKPNA